MFAPRASPYLAFGLSALVAFGLAWGFTGQPFTAVVIPALVALSAVWAFFAIFFRDPERPVGPGIVSPADGRVRAVERAGDRVLVSIFMNVTDVHVNRLPVDARVISIEGTGAGHRPAYAESAERNVRKSYRLETSLGPVEVVQITGWLARRLVPMVRVGDARLKGERFGMIVLGSRVDLWLPVDRVRVTTHVGQRVRAGQSSVAEAL